MKTNINYVRVIPRDLFNEAKLLKCIGRLILLIHDNVTPVKMSFIEKTEGEPFTIGLMEEGSLTIANLEICINDVPYTFKTTYNSKANYPLYVDHDYCDYEVFTETGAFSPEFYSFCKNELALEL